MSTEKFKPGSMDISVHEKTFRGFLNLVAIGATVCIVVLIFAGLVNG